MRVFGQELNPESYAICKADMLIKGQDVRNIKLGNTLSNDQLAYEKFDYMLSNPPFGVDWKKIEQDIKDEHEQKGFEGRFGAGLPRVSDGSLLFLMHLISKMRDTDSNGQGSRIGIILNGSPLFTGSAGSGESEIRRYILEADLLEAIIALPTDMFYNTGIATYVWVLSNKKDAERKGKVHLINATNLSSKMRKSLGSKRNYLTDEEIRTITQNYGAFEAVDTLANDGESDQKKPFSSKIFNSYEFGYRRVTIERPLRLSAQVSDDAVASLRFAPKPFNAVMQFLYEHYGKKSWTEETYGELYEYDEYRIRSIIKSQFSELKEKDIKTLFEPKIWLDQRNLMRKAESIQSQIGTDQYDDFNQFQELLTEVVSELNLRIAMYNLYQRFGKIWESDNFEKNKLDISIFIKTELLGFPTSKIKKLLDKDTWKNNEVYLELTESSKFDYENYLIHKQELIDFTAKEHKQFIDAITWKNADAEPVINKVMKGAEKPLYGQFTYKGKVVEFVQDGDLRDAENIALDPSQSTTDLIESYFKREVQPHVPDAWINADKRDAQDGEIGIVGYEIPFNRHFYVYEPPRDLVEIDADLDAVSREIMTLLQEVHS